MASDISQLRVKFHNFDLNAMLRGAQLTLVGANRALQNPNLFTSEQYKQAALAVAAGIVIRILIAIPTIAVRLLIWSLGFFYDLKSSTWDDDVINGLDFIEHSVLQVPFFLMSLMRFVTPTLDNVFMESLDWVDRTYMTKHKSDDPKLLRAMYYPNLRLYQKHRSNPEAPKKKPMDAIIAFLMRSGTRALLSLGVYMASYLPYIGRLVLPAVSFWTFKKAVGTQPAAVIFAGGLFLPRHYLVTFLQSYFSSRSLMRQLLDPYFSRIHFTAEQKRKWFKEREGVLFGFGLGFFAMVKIPLVGVLVYGVAEASTAYLLTKITDPPPPPAEEKEFAASQTTWQNRHEFLSLPLAALDKMNVDETAPPPLKEQAYPRKQFS